jgi:hypothetical protein
LFREEGLGLKFPQKVTASDSRAEVIDDGLQLASPGIGSLRHERRLGLLVKWISHDRRLGL